MASCLLFVSFLLGGCAARARTPPPQAGREGTAGGHILLPGRSSADAVVLFDRYRQRFITYDVPTRAIEEQSDVPNYLQYEFPTPSDLYTAGNSVTYGFSIVRVSGNTIQTVIEMDENEGVFPLATDRNRTFFIRTHYDKKGAEDRRQLVRLDSRAGLVEYPNALGLIDSGALLGDALFYTIFVEGAQSYALHRLDADDPNGTPELVRNGLESGRLYVHDGQLFTADRTSIFNQNERFDCTDLCYFFDSEDILVRIHADESSALALDVINTETSQPVGTMTDVIDFRVAEGKVAVYAPGRVDTIEIPG